MAETGHGRDALWNLVYRPFLGFLFAPLAWLIGIKSIKSSNEILLVGQLIGTKLFATEFFAFADLAVLQANGMSQRLRFCQPLLFVDLPISCPLAFKLVALVLLPRVEDQSLPGLTGKA